MGLPEVVLVWRRGKSWRILWGSNGRILPSPRPSPTRAERGSRDSPFPSRAGEGEKSECSFVMGRYVGNGKVLGEAVLGSHVILDAPTDGVHLDPSGDVGGEGVGEEVAGGFHADAAGAEVEQHVLVDRAGRAAVGALDVVGVDLQRRLAVHVRIIR